MSCTAPCAVNPPPAPLIKGQNSRLADTSATDINIQLSRINFIASFY